MRELWQSPQVRRRVTTIVAVLLVFATVLSGTFAWRNYRSHRTNEGAGGSLRYKARLVEEFDPKDTKDWKVEQGPVQKTVRVYNPAREVKEDPNDYGPVFVRIMLKDFHRFHRFRKG